MAQLERAHSFAPYGRWFNAAWCRDYRATSRIADSLGMEAGSPDYQRVFKPS